MTDLPYTDADLRHEAARHFGDDMNGLEILVAMTDHAPWQGLDTDDFNTAHSQITQLIEGAADVSEWAVNLGADGLQPDGHHADFGHHPDGPVPLMRVHFAFHPEADDTDRHALAQLATEAVQAALNHALDD